MLALAAEVRRWVEYRAYYPGRYVVDSLRGLGPRLGGAPRGLHVLFATDGREVTSEQQLAPLRAQRALLRERLGLVFNHLLLGDAVALPGSILRRYDVIGVKASFRRSAEDVGAQVGRLREKVGERVAIVYLDGDDDLGVNWPSILPDLDLYVKKHVHADPTRYLSPTIGKTNLTDYVARVHGISFTDDIIPSRAGVAADQVHKIVHGWNVALDDPIRKLRGRLAARRGRALPAKDVDVICRASVRDGDWILPFRRPLVGLLGGLSRRYAVLTPAHRVDPETYLAEMLRSRICVCPFGYGEICWRDFEAVLCGCVVVKPDMSHVRTEPDIYVAGETYLPVRWDFADLVETLRAALARPRELERIRRNAEDVLDRYFRENRFVDAVGRVLARCAPVARLN